MKRAAMSVLAFWAHLSRHAKRLAARSWDGWRTVLGAFTGMTLEQVEAFVPDALARFCQLTGRTCWGAVAYSELWAVAGRRGGKSYAIAVLSLWLALMVPYAMLMPGERGVVAVYAADRRQARQVVRYVTGLVHVVPDLREFVDGEARAEGLDFWHGAWQQATAIEVQTANWRLARSGTCVAAICDELAFWRAEDDGANPDAEILAAIRPSLATTEGPLVCISSPYAKRGELFETHGRCYAVDDEPVLVVQAPSWVLNPGLPQSFLDREKERDPARFRAEYGAAFRDDVEHFITEALVARAIVPGRVEVPPTRVCTSHNPHMPRPWDDMGVTRVAFIDPAGGTGQDSATLAIASRSRASISVELEFVREIRPPFSPSQAMATFAADLKRYGLSRAYGDAYAGDWPAEALRRNGCDYTRSQWNRSELFLELLPLLAANEVRLLDLPRLRAQLLALERRTTAAGRDAVTHGRTKHAHDDVANAVAGACVYANHAFKQASTPPATAIWVEALL